MKNNKIVYVSKCWRKKKEKLLFATLGLVLGILLGIGSCYIYSQFIETTIYSASTIEEVPESIQIQEVVEEPVELKVMESAPPPRYGFTDDDIYLMTVLLSGSKDVDGDGEFDIDYRKNIDYDQTSLVLCVVMNRVQSEKFQNTVSEVIWQKGQFSPMVRWTRGIPKVSDISLKLVTEWCTAYDAWDDSVQTIPENHLYFSGDGRKNYSR